MSIKIFAILILLFFLFNCWSTSNTVVSLSVLDAVGLDVVGLDAMILDAVVVGISLASATSFAIPLAAAAFNIFEFEPHLPAKCPFLP